MEVGEDGEEEEEEEEGEEPINASKGGITSEEKEARRFCKEKGRGMSSHYDNIDQQNLEQGRIHGTRCA